MKRFLLLFPLAACAPHVDPCLRPIVEIPRCVERDGADHLVPDRDVRDHDVDGEHHGGGSSDDNGDVSDE